MLLAFFAVVLPLLGFAALVDELRESGVFFFDQPLILRLPTAGDAKASTAFFVLDLEARLPVGRGAARYRARPAPGLATAVPRRPRSFVAWR